MSMFFSSPAGSASTLQATVTSRVPSRVMSMLPSNELCTETCSISTLEAASVTQIPSCRAFRMRSPRMTMSWPGPRTMRPALRSVTPGAGALSPSTVVNESRMVISLVRVIVPATSNTTVRFPPDTASRRLPGPELLRFVTWTMAPAEPPGVEAPNPSVPVAGSLPARIVPITKAAATYPRVLMGHLVSALRRQSSFQATDVRPRRLVWSVRDGFPRFGRRVTAPGARVPRARAERPWKAFAQRSTTDGESGRGDRARPRSGRQARCAHVPSEAFRGNTGRGPSRADSRAPARGARDHDSGRARRESHPVRGRSEPGAVRDLARSRRPRQSGLA